MFFYVYFYYFYIRITYYYQHDTKIIKNILNKAINKPNSIELKKFGNIQNKCICCSKSYIFRKNNKRVINGSFKTVGKHLALILLNKYNILVSPKRYICTKCYTNIFGIIKNIKLQSWNKQIWNNNKIINKNLYNKYKLICGKLFQCLSTTKFKNYQYSDKFEQLKKDIFEKIGSKKLKKYYKRYFGIDRIGLLKVYDEVYKSLKYKKTGIKLEKFNSTCIYIFDKNDKVGIMEDLMILFSKWRMALPNETLGCVFGKCQQYISKKIYRGTALLIKYTNKYLVNTKEKLKLETPNKYIRKLMKLGNNCDVVNGDGIRFKTQKSVHFQSQQKTYDNKHKYNAYNCIGFNTVKSGKYIGFYPITGVGSDGHHWDGYVLDFLIFNNIDNILGWLTVNSEPFKNDGTRIIFDRALGKGCITFTEGVINYTTPCLVMNRKKKQQKIIKVGQKQQLQDGVLKNHLVILVIFGIFFHHKLFQFIQIILVYLVYG